MTWKPRTRRQLGLLLISGILGSIAAWAARGSAGHAQSAAAECRDWQAQHPEWIFCDDFETDAPMRSPERYFEYGEDEGDFVPLDGAGFQGSRGMRTIFQEGEVGGGGMKLAFGRNPNTYMRSYWRSDEDFREVYYRMYLRMQPGWRGDPAKLSRATIFTHQSDWSQAMIAHLWGDGRDHLLIDPVRCVDERNRVKCLRYNDFDNMDWLGYRPGSSAVFATEESGRWRCVEAHVRLNDPGQANGVNEFWVDDNLEVRRDDLDFVRSYTDYGINAIFFENYWNDGSLQEQERYFDNIVVSTERIGCLDAPPAPSPSPSPEPAPPTAQPTPSTIPPGTGWLWLPRLERW